MSGIGLFLLCGAFVVAGVYNAWRAWHWTEVPEVLRGREHLIPIQVPGIVFFGSAVVFYVADVIAGHPEDGSSAGVAVGTIAGAVALLGLVLGITTYWFGRPQRLIAPIARDVPRWSPG